MTKRHHSETIERFVDLEAVVAISEEEEDEEDEGETGCTDSPCWSKLT